MEENNKDIENINDVNDTNIIDDIDGIKIIKDIKDVNDVNDTNIIDDINGIKGIKAIKDINDIEGIENVKDVKDAKNEQFPENAISEPVTENYEQHEIKKMEIVKGNSKNLNISKVQDSLPFEIEENTEETKQNIIIPKNQKN